jgi:hypothetical protein
LRLDPKDKSSITALSSEEPPLPDTARLLPLRQTGCKRKSAFSASAGNIAYIR